jgi:predicted membrane-bound spermidine synthase
VKISVRFLVLAGLFGIVVGIVYWFLAHEQAGTTLLLAMGVAPMIMAYVVWRRTAGRRFPEDDGNASYADDAGDELGRFSAGSLWPFVMAGGVLLGLQGFIYGVWLLVSGLVIFAWATIGLMQESRG